MKPGGAAIGSDINASNSRTRTSWPGGDGDPGDDPKRPRLAVDGGGARRVGRPKMALPLPGWNMWKPVRWAWCNGRSKICGKMRIPVMECDADWRCPDDGGAAWSGVRAFVPDPEPTRNQFVGAK